MTDTQATAEVLWVAFQALDDSAKDAFIARLLANSELREDFVYAEIVDSRMSEPLTRRDDYCSGSTIANEFTGG